MFKRKHFVAIIVTALVSLLVLALPTRLSLQIRTALSSVFLPLFGLSSATEAATDTLALKLTPRSALETEVSRLRRENEELHIRLAAAEEVTRENERLRRQLAWQTSIPWKLRPGRVILRDPANWWRAVQINIGSRDGVRIDDPVVTDKGLVGRVSAVAYDHAQVVLLGDPGCKVSAVIGDQERNAGIIERSSSLSSALVEMTYLPRHAEIETGAPVRTSGLGGVFPKGILVGHVVDTRSVEYGLHLTARVRLSANLSALEDIWVIVE